MVADLSAQFRLLLDHLDATDPEDLLQFFQMLDQLKGEAVHELAPRLMLVGSTERFRRLVAEAAYYYPGPEWVVPLSRCLRRESDLDVFAVGVRALVHIGSPESELELQRLSSLALESSKQEILFAALQASDPARAFEYHLSRLFQGSGNPTVANQAATELRRIIGPDHLEDLQVVVYHEDLLIARHALKLITYLQSWVAAQFLFAYFMECHQETLDDRALKAILAELKAVPAADMWGALLEALAVRLEERSPGSLAKLRVAGLGGGEDALAEAAGLKQHAQGNVELVLLEGLEILLRGQGSRMPSFLAEATSGLQARARRLPFAIDTCAVGLESMVSRGLLVPGHLCDLLTQSFVAQTGREATARVFGSFVAPEDDAALEAILGSGDVSLRSAALEAIGARHDARFLPFLLRACRDSIDDVAGRMVLALGNLEGGADCATQLLTSRTPDDVFLGLRIIRVNRMTDLADTVLAFLEANTREDLSLEAVAVLGELGVSDGALLERLHSGQSPRMQIALAKAVMGRDPRGVAMDLARLAVGLRHPDVWAIASEGLIAAWRPEGGMPSTASAQLVALVQACWEERTQSLRTRLIGVIKELPPVELDHAGVLLSLLTACAEDKRALAGWTADQQNHLAAGTRHLRRMLEVQVSA